MTRKHFQWFAQFCCDHNLSRAAMQDLMDYFSELNSNFDEERFIEATRRYGDDRWQGLV